MERLTLERFILSDAVVIGKIYRNNKVFCYTLENPWRNNQRKVSCVPEGVYKCLPYKSKKYPHHIELQNVKDRSKILIHVGNSTDDTDGCILTGLTFNPEKNRILKSKKAFKKLLSEVGRTFTLEIINQKSKGNSMVVASMGASLLLKLAGGFVSKKVSKKLTSKTAKMILKEAGDLAGIKIESEADVKIAKTKLSSGDLKAIEVAAIKADADMFIAEMKHGEDLTKSWKDEFITVIPWVAFFYILVTLTFNIELGAVITKSITELMKSSFGIILVVVSLSAAGMRSAVMSYINKKF